MERVSLHVFFFALRRGSGEQAGSVSSWQNKPTPPTHTHTRDLTPGRTAAKPADVYVTAFLPTACRNVQAHTLTNTDTHTQVGQVV